jgi:hypothetical protein
MSSDAEAALASFLAKFTPEIEAKAGAIIARMRARLPGAVIPVYDNYNALAVGFGPTDRVSDVILSVAVMPRRVLLYFMYGASLPDPGGLLQGSGNQGRHIPLESPDRLDDPAVEAMIATALEAAKKPIDPVAIGGVVIKSISARQRPRRPA